MKKAAGKDDNLFGPINVNLNITEDHLQVLQPVKVLRQNTHAQARSQDCKFGGGSFSVWWGADIFRVLLYCYSLLAMSTVSVTEYTNIVVIE